MPKKNTSAITNNQKILWNAAIAIIKGQMIIKLNSMGMPKTIQMISKNIKTINKVRTNWPVML